MRSAPRSQPRGVEFEYIAGFGPISTDPTATHAFRATTPGIPEVAPGYFHAQGLEGAKASALWPLDPAGTSSSHVP